MEVGFSDERHPFKKLSIDGSKVSRTFDGVAQIEDDISCITTDFLMQNAYVEKKSSVSVKEKPLTFLYNKYAFKGPYLNDNNITNQYPENLKAAIRDYTDLYKKNFDGVLLPLYVIASYDGSFYLVFPNIYKELSLIVFTYTLDNVKKTYGGREIEKKYTAVERYRVIDSKTILNVLNALKVIPDKNNIPFVSILYNLIKLYAIGAIGMTFNNILVNTSSYAFYLVDVADTFSRGSETKIVDDNDRYFYINRMKITEYNLFSSDAIQIWSELLEKNIDTVYDMLETEKLPHIEDILRRLKIIMKDISESQNVELSPFEKAAIGIDPPKSTRVVQSKMQAYNPMLIQKTKKTVPKSSGFSSRFYSSAATKKKPVKEEIQEINLEEGLYADIWLGSGKKEEQEISPETIPVFDLSDTLPKARKTFVPPKFYQTQFTSLEQRKKVYGKKGGMQSLGGKKDKTYSSNISSLKVVNYTASDIYTVANVISFLVFYIRVADIEKAFMAATELWRMHEINSIYGTRMLFLTLRRVAIRNIGPINNTLVIKVISKTLEWSLLLEKKGKNIDDVLDFVNVLSLIEEMVNSDKTQIHILMEKSFTEWKEETSSLFKEIQLDYEVYSLNDNKTILEELVENDRDLVKEVVGLFKPSDDIELLELFTIYYVLLKNLTQNSIVFLDAIISLSDEKKIVRGIKKNPIFFLFNVLTLVYQNDSIIFFEQYYSTDKSDAKSILMYLTTNYILNKKLGSNTELIKKKISTQEYLSGDYKFKLDNILLSNLNDLRGNSVFTFPLEDEIDTGKDLLPEEYDFYYSVYERS